MNETFKGSWARSTCELYSVADFYLLHVRKDIFFFFVLWCIGRQGNRPEPFLVGWSHIHTDVPLNFPTCQFFLFCFFLSILVVLLQTWLLKKTPKQNLLEILPHSYVTTLIYAWFYLDVCLSYYSTPVWQCGQSCPPCALGEIIMFPHACNTFFFASTPCWIVFSWLFRFHSAFIQTFKFSFVCMFGPNVKEPLAILWGVDACSWCVFVAGIQMPLHCFHVSFVFLHILFLNTRLHNCCSNWATYYI